MPVVHVLTMARTVPSDLAAAVLSGVEKALVEAGASRIWIDPLEHDVAVMAELPERLAHSIDLDVDIGPCDSRALDVTPAPARDR
ncbi:hypothetical protein G6553_13220 [Nocardioides sp. IC4_145]|uniref:hypothetical protein n=1 Tax=Nocardioides sp. IC4_145 TaxID=2714037 RepID=UPI00140C24DE|nr:hypothetical protein [Nocardioides sp. IC4_145]NHC24127.1 hypothetical protein [Nocardioides sp. IC4_145]